MKRFMRGFLQLFGTLCLLGLLAGTALLVFAGYWMDVNDPPIQADYILPLAGDSHRMLKAAELYNQGYAPTILLSNARAYPPTRMHKLKWQMGYPRYSREQFLSLLLPLIGAGSAHLEEFGNGHISTVEEAEALRDHLAGRQSRLLIVTSPYHARRAKMIFEDILSDCTISVSVTEEGAFDKKWWLDQVSAQNIVMELAKTIHYALGGAFRSTEE